MAYISIKSPSSPRFAGSVVAVSVYVSYLPAGSSLHMVKMRVVSSEGRYEGIDFSVTLGDYTIDISEALKAMMGEPSFDPNKMQDVGKELEKNVLQYHIEAGLSDMKNGEIHDAFTDGDTSNEVVKTGDVYAVRGALTDREMMRYSNGILSGGPMLLSHKPSKGELITHKEYKSLRSKLSNATNPSVEISISDITAQHKTMSESRRFCFINTLGVPEMICANCYPILSYEHETKVYNRHVEVSDVPKTSGNIYVSHKELFAKYEMSSGAVTSDWARWWVTEFLKASAWWMYDEDSSMWLPVSVHSKQNEQMVYDRSKADTLHVDFIVTSALT